MQTDKIDQNDRGGQVVWIVVCTNPNGDYAHYKPWKENGVHPVHQTEETAEAELRRVVKADWPRDMPGIPWPADDEAALEQLATRDALSLGRTLPDPSLTSNRPRLGQPSRARPPHLG